MPYNPRPDKVSSAELKVRADQFLESLGEHVSVLGATALDAECVNELAGTGYYLLSGTLHPGGQGAMVDIYRTGPGPVELAHLKAFPDSSGGHAWRVKMDPAHTARTTAIVHNSSGTRYPAYRGRYPGIEYSDPRIVGEGIDTEVTVFSTVPPTPVTAPRHNLASGFTRIDNNGEGIAVMFAGVTNSPEQLLDATGVCVAALGLDPDAAAQYSRFFTEKRLARLDLVAGS